jgi:hypothetical protein
MDHVSVATVYELIERLRPHWLTPGTLRSVNLRTEIAVVQDGSYYGNVGSLRSIAAGGLREIQYLTGSEAAGAFPNLPRGAIEAAIVIHRSPSR